MHELLNIGVDRLRRYFFSGRHSQLLSTIVFASLAGSLATPVAALERYILQLDTGGHQAAIKDVILLENGALIATAGDDKIVRIWDRRTGKTVRTIRGQAEGGNYGKIYAMAVSPDGKWLATAGWMDESDALEPCCGDIRLFEFATGKLAARLKGHTNAVYDLAFSEDSRMLASGGADNIAIVWGVAQKAELFRLEDVQGHSDRIVRVEFMNSGRNLITAGYDGKVKNWSITDRKWLGDLISHKTRVYALAVSRDGKSVASGDANGEIKHWTSSSNNVKTLSQQGVSIGALSFSQDARKILSTCGYRCPESPGQVVWDVETGKEIHRHTGHDGSVSAGALSSDGTFAVTAGGDNHEIHIWKTDTGEVERVLKGAGKAVTSVALSKAKDLLAWGYIDPCPQEVVCPNVPGVLEYELGLPTKSKNFEPPRSTGSGDVTSLLRTTEKAGGVELTLQAGGQYNRKDAILRIKKDKKDVARMVRDQTNGFGHTSYTLVNNGAVLISGGEHGTLTSYASSKGSVLKDFIGHTAIVTAMANSVDSSLLATSSADQTVRLWNVKTGELIVSLLHTTDGEWVMWTEQGYYNASPNGDRLVGWQINQGPDKEARHVTARQLKEHLLSPEIIRRAIVLGSAEKAIKELRKSAKTLDSLLTVEPPSFDIATPADGATVNRNSATVTIRLAEGAARPERVEVIANIRNVTPADFAIAPDAKDVSFTVPIRPGDNKIRVIAYNSAGYTAERQIVLSNYSDGAAEVKGRLYVVAIGVNSYPGLPKSCDAPEGDCDLLYAVKDARTFHEAVIKTVAPRYKGVSSLLLVNGAKMEHAPEDSPTKIIEAEPVADRIKTVTEFLAQSTPEDMTVFFLAGHGANIGEDYYFLPTNTAVNPDGELDVNSLVSWRALQQMVHKARGTRMMFIDTCHSGNAYNARLEKDGIDADIIVLSATKANSVSKELKSVGHGAFTFSMVNGLKGKADRDNNQTVELFEFSSFTASEVKKLTKETQVPVLYSSGVEDFVIAWP